MGRSVLHRECSSRLSVAAFTVVAGVLAASSPAVADTRGNNDVSVASTPALQQYRALRRMHAVVEKLNQEGWLDVRTELDGRTFRYEIVSERGSETVLKKLKAILEREKELHASGDPERAELNSDNYEFSAEADGPGYKYISIKPKRKDLLLVEGRMVLSGEGRDLLRVEGKLSKNPSFWTSLVNVVRRFARIDGVRVPIATESTAKVKFAGKATLDVDYEYETINGRPVSQQARRLMAANFVNR
jgi:hypothetical protein